MCSLRPTEARLDRSRVWLFVPPGAGDLHQLEALAEAIGGSVRRIDRIDPIGRVLIDRLRSLFRLPAGVPADLQAPWPDLVLMAGGRSVIDARRVARCSGGRTKLVCLGRPWAPLRWFDLVVTTPQYRLPQAANVESIELPLNRPKDVDPATLEFWAEQFSGLARPLLGVLLGGDSGSFRFGAASVDRIVAALRQQQARTGGSLVVVGSPRTPEKVFTRLRQSLSGAARLYPWTGQGANPYAALLRLADGLAVTGDSASMLAEACFSARPVAVLPLQPRLHTRILGLLRRATAPFEPIFAALTVRGLWVPARDLERLHRELERRGWLQPLSRLSESGVARDPPDPQALMTRVGRRIEALLAQGRAQ